MMKSTFIATKCCYQIEIDIFSVFKFQIFFEKNLNKLSNFYLKIDF